MAGYAASSRIGSVAPRARIDRPGAARFSLTDQPVAVVLIDLVGKPPASPSSERMAALRERWAQATFFLFDANSWR
ncbi:MAG: hypothetical protein ACSLFN_12050 [Candidatus Limnocylindrales bacterium]